MALSQAIRHDLDIILHVIVEYTPYSMYSVFTPSSCSALSEHLIHPAFSLEVAYKLFAAQKIAFYKHQNACMDPKCLSNNACFK